MEKAQLSFTWRAPLEREIGAHGHHGYSYRPGLMTVSFSPRVNSAGTTAGRVFGTEQGWKVMKDGFNLFILDGWPRYAADDILPRTCKHSLISWIERDPILSTLRLLRATKLPTRAQEYCIPTLRSWTGYKRWSAMLSVGLRVKRQSRPRMHELYHQWYSVFWISIRQEPSNPRDVCTVYQAVYRIYDSASVRLFDKVPTEGGNRKNLVISHLLCWVFYSSEVYDVKSMIGVADYFIKTPQRAPCLVLFSSFLQSFLSLWTCAKCTFSSPLCFIPLSWSSCRRAAFTPPNS